MSQAFDYLLSILASHSCTFILLLSNSALNHCSIFVPFSFVASYPVFYRSLNAAFLDQVYIPFISTRLFFVLLDEFASYRKEGLFVNSPRFGNTGTSLLLQLQAVIAEYERALIKERSRRGKRSKARAGIVTLLEAV